MSKKDDTYAPRPWKCGRCSHVLGLVFRDQDRVRRLSVFRVPKTEAQAQMAIEYQDGGELMFGEALFVAVEVDSGTVLCQHCGARRKWDISEEAMRELQERRQVRSFGLEKAHEPG